MIDIQGLVRAAVRAVRLKSREVSGSDPGTPEHILSVDIATMPDVTVSAAVEGPVDQGLPGATAWLAALAAADPGLVALAAAILAGTQPSSLLSTDAGLVAQTAALIAQPAFFSGNQASADTDPHAIASQAVKGPVYLKVDSTMTGHVTISDGTHGGVQLVAGEALLVPCSNLSQITYQFSVNAGTESFGYTAGV